MCCSKVRAYPSLTRSVVKYFSAVTCASIIIAVPLDSSLLAQDWNREVLMLRPANEVGEKAVLDELRNRAEEALSRIRRARAAGEADAARPVLRHHLEESLGFRLVPRGPALNARVVGTLEREDYRIEKIVYDTA